MIKKLKIKFIDEVRNFVNMNFDFIFQSRQLNENSVSFSITKPLSLEYGIPQFSTSILSFSRSYMNDIYFKASDMNIPIYYSNTDCCLLDRENIDKLGIVGNKLGEFKIEYENIVKLFQTKPVLNERLIIFKIISIRKCIFGISKTI